MKTTRALVVILFSMGLTPAAAIETIEILGLFKDTAVVKLDGKRRVLKKGEASHADAVLISANSEQAIIEVNGEQKTYTLNSKISSVFSRPADGQLVTIAPGPSGIYAISGSINGFNIDFLVDTGATLISMNRNVAKRLGLDYRLEGKESRASTASGIAKIYLMNLKRVRVGDIELHNVEAAVHEGDFPTVTLLGMSFLGRLNMKREDMLLQLEKK